MLTDDEVQRIAALYHIVEKTATVSAGRFAYISGEAMAELNELNSAIGKRRAQENPPPAPAQQGEPVDEPEPSKPVGSLADPDQVGLFPGTGIATNTDGDASKPGVIKARL